MKIYLLLCGKTTEKWLTHAISIYIKRIKNYVSFEEIVIPDVKFSSKMPSNEMKEKEGTLILQQITDNNDFLVTLDENGKEFDSVSFANELQKLLNLGRKRIIFVVGGPYGLSSDVYKRSNLNLSLSQMTFSHQLVRVIFLEQLYRAFTILNNGPYHHK